jgi:hypothetical protein
MQKKQMKFSDLPVNDRYILVGKLIDAMVYSEDACFELHEKVREFEEKGYIRSTFNPDTIEEQPLGAPVPRFPNTYLMDA